MGVIKTDWARYPGLFLLALWAGGIFFFSIGVAPVAFRIMPSQQAGEMVRGSLSVLHGLGLICGAAFLFHSLLQEKAQRMAQGLVLGMLLLTAISQWVVTPKIEELRRSREVQSERFSRLHRASTSLEAVVLLMGFVAMWQIAAATKSPE